MADSNDEDRSDILSAPEPDRPSFEPPKPDRAPAPAKAPTAKRRAFWGTAIAVVAVGVATTSVMISKGSKQHDRPSSMASSPAPRTLPTLPLSAVHDVHGLIVTLPSIRRVLGSTPILEVNLHDNRLAEENLDGTRVTDEDNGGLVDNSSRFRMLDITLTRWPSPTSFKKSWGRDGPGPFHKDTHNWFGATTRITGLKGAAIIYQRSDGPNDTTIQNRKIKYDQIGATLEARYRNIMIRIDFTAADFSTSSHAKVGVTHIPHSQTKRELTEVARKIMDHL